MSTMIDRTEVLSLARASFGASCELDSLEGFVGGVRKQTFYVQLKYPTVRCLLIVWDSQSGYFLEREVAGFEESQSDSVAPHAFLKHTEYLNDLGVNVPPILHFGQAESGPHFAFVERIDGSDYGRFSARASPAERESVMKELARQVQIIHGVERAHPGGVFSTASPHMRMPMDQRLDAALVELDATSETEPFIAKHRQRIQDALTELRAAIKPREGYRLLHGELDPSHILVRDKDHRVYLVDIEGVAFGDVEGEHTFLRWRFSPDDYCHLMRDDLDPARMDYYKLLMHVSHVYAGSRLLMREHPAKELAQQILSGNMSELRRLLDLRTGNNSLG